MSKYGVYYFPVLELNTGQKKLPIWALVTQYVKLLKPFHDTGSQGL